MFLIFSSLELLFVVFVVGFDDLLHQAVAHHVLLSEAVDGDVVDALQDLGCHREPASIAKGKVRLGGVSRHDRLGMVAKAR